MLDVLWALLFMTLGGLIVHVAWVHSWHMYRNGKAEGQGLTYGNRQAGSRVVK